jgi:hypothetical protein
MSNKYNLLATVGSDNEAMRAQLRDLTTDEVAKTITDEQLDEALNIGRRVLIDRLEDEIIMNASRFINGMYNPFTGERLHTQ